MGKYTRYIYAPMMVAAVTLAACGGENADDTLATDLELAGQDSAQAALQDVPAASAPAPRPSTSAPRPKPAPKPATTAGGNTVTSGSRERAVGTIAAGTTLQLAANNQVCTNTHKVGQTINARLRNAVSGSNGATIPAGATVGLEVTELKRSENANDNIIIGFAPRSVSYGGNTYRISGSLTSAQVDRVRNQPGGKDAQKVATGAAVGAVLGQVLGKSTKSTVIGGAIGAAAGAGTAAATANYEGCVPAGGSIVVSLSESVQVHS